MESSTATAVNTELDAVVVGSGPNGLAAAITLARAGCSVLVVEANPTIGGGVRSAELTLPGFTHDICSAVYPLAAASPCLRAWPLEQLGLEWVHPDIPLAHPLDDGSAACLYQDVQATSDSLGEDGQAYSKLFTPLARDWEKLAHEFLQPMLHLPHSPFALAKFGIRAMCSATFLARTLFERAPARALFGGIAAHSFLPLESPVSSAFALVLGAAGHVVGWPFVRGGSQSLSNALAKYLQQLGGKIEINQRVESIEQLPSSRVTLFDVSTWQFARIAANRLPQKYLRRLKCFRHAPAVFKLDYALSAPIPWRSESCRRAGTVHAIGSLEEIAIAERAVADGKIPERPFVLVAQQSLFDQRAPGGQHTLWAYCHLPSGCAIDVSDKIERQIERFAPGFRDCIIARHKTNAADLERSNANLVEGDINGGAATVWQLLARPTLSPTPYRTPIPGVYLCSASTPPGGGVHGMCGYYAARTALRDFFKHRLAVVA